MKQTIKSVVVVGLVLASLAAGISAFRAFRPSTDEFDQASATPVFDVSAKREMSRWINLP